MEVKEIVKAMSLEEKATMCSGKDFWHLAGFEKYGIPEMMVTDGPHGLRKQDGEADHLGINESIQAVCFPAGCALASSYNRDLAKRVGETLGNECQAENVGVILGPAVNIKRSPLCGRNFEYLSEDPYVASEMAANYIEGVQSKGVGTSMKHFFANNQESQRMNSSSELSDRTAREIYLAAFEGAVKQAKPWSVMSSYNKINGTFSSENKKYLTDILRNEWGFDGFVVSDWGAVNNIVEDVKAGLNLEMPSSNGVAPKMLVDAVDSGKMDEETLNHAVEELLNIILRVKNNRDENAVFDRQRDHEISKEVAAECMVLLKNDGALPLQTEEDILFVGEFAKRPRYQGGGSSHINSYKVVGALEAAPENVKFCQGYLNDTVENQEALLEEAVREAKKAKKVVVFAGLPDSFESEGYDREHMNLPENQDKLIQELAKANSQLIVVLHNGAPIEMPWANDVNAILETYLCGEAVGEATVQILYGEVNPSGHLTESFPMKLQDNPSYLFYGGEKGIVEYREGVFVGYRYYDSKEQDVRFPFGHGLSYTTFAFSNLKAEKKSITDTDTVKVHVDVTNTGDREGKEVVQLYVHPQKGKIIRPVHELRKFEKIELAAGETKTVEFELSKSDFAYYEEKISDWYVEAGNYTIEVGDSSRNLPVHVDVEVNPEKELPLNITMETGLGDILSIPAGQEVLGGLLGGMMDNVSEVSDEDGGMSEKMVKEMVKDMPLRTIVMMSGGSFTYEQAESMVSAINKKINEKA